MDPCLSREEERGEERVGCFELEDGSELSRELTLGMCTGSRL